MFEILMTTIIARYSVYRIDQNKQDYKRRKEGNVLFNYGYISVRHIVKDHSDCKKGNLLPPHRLLFLINSKDFLYAPSHRQDSTYHGLCYTSRGALAWTRNSSMGSSLEGSIRWPIAPWANALTMELHLAPVRKQCYLIRQDNTIYKCFSIKLSFSSIGQDKSKLRKK